jgi:hypothetical protein
MTVRVRHVGTELFPEGVVEVVREANGWSTDPTDFGEAIDLTVVWEDEDTGKKHKRTVGRISAGTWASVVVLDHDYVEAE